MNAEIAWMAGVFDSSGWIVLNQYGSVQLRLESADEDLIARFLDLSIDAGLTPTSPPPRKRSPTTKMMWGWCASGWPNCVLAHRLWEPWLCRRRHAQFEKVFVARRDKLASLGVSLDHLDVDLRSVRQRVR